MRGLQENSGKGDFFMDLNQLILKHCKPKHSFSILLISLLVGLLLFQIACAQADPLSLEARQVWDWEGFACLYGNRAVLAADADGDGVNEILTCNFAGGLGLPSPFTQAQFRIWSSDGASLTLKNSQEWLAGNRAYVNCVFVSDVDGDDVKEIVTGGMISDGTRRKGQLSVWRWDSAMLVLENSQEWPADSGSAAAGCVFVADVDGDTDQEIVTSGTSFNGTYLNAQLRIWDGATLALDKNQEWFNGGNTTLNSVFVADVDGDTDQEIVTGGYAFDGASYHAQLRIWDGATLSLEKSQEWIMVEGNPLNAFGSPMIGTEVDSVDVADVDGDGVKEIVTGGTVYDGTRVNSQFRIWSWDGTELLMEKSEEWVKEQATAIHSLSVADVDGDGAIEVVTGGYVYYEEGFKGQIRVYNWDGSTLSLEEDHEFSTPNYAQTAINALNIGDVDGDGVKEIIAGGCVYMSKETTICNAFLTVWSISSTPFSYEFYAILAIISIMIVCTLAFLVIRRRK
jgi:hypothetical protein